jgi:hypothetical protein
LPQLEEAGAAFPNSDFLFFYEPWRGCKLAPRESPELAVIRARELERGNPNRVTLAVARKMVSYMLAVECRNQDFVPAEEFSRTAAA